MRFEDGGEGDKGHQKKEEKTEKEKEVVNCPNRSNPYHECSEYCRLRWGGEADKGRVSMCCCLHW